MSRLLASIATPANLLAGIAPGALEQHIQARIIQRLREHLQSEIDASIRGSSAMVKPIGLLRMDRKPGI